MSIIKALINFFTVNGNVVATILASIAMLAIIGAIAILIYSAREMYHNYKTYSVDKTISKYSSHDWMDML